MAFKYLTSCVPEYFSSHFIKRGEISGRTMRSSQMLNIPLFKTVNITASGLVFPHLIGFFFATHVTFHFFFVISGVHIFS